MEIIQNVILILIGFSGGIAVAGGVFAFISILEIVPRLVGRMQISSHIYQMETLIAAGGITGCIISVFQLHFAVGVIGMMIIGFFAGAFVGALVMAIAETLKVIPVLCQRVSLQFGLPFVIASLALGKALGSLYQLYFRAK